MKIAVFIKSTTFSKGHGGLETQNKSLCEALVSMGHEIVVFSPKKNNAKDDLSNSQIQNGVKYIFVNARYKNSSFLESLLNLKVKDEWYKASYEAFFKERSEKAFDLVISQSSAGLGVIRQKRYLGVPVVSIAHGTIMSEFKTLLSRPASFLGVLRLIKDFQYSLLTYFTRQKEFILGSDFVVCVSKHVQKSIINETGVPESKTAVIYNGVNKIPMQGNKNYKKFVYVGRVEADKGISELLIAFKKVVLNCPAASLSVVGDGSGLTQAKKIATELGLTENVLFQGHIAHDGLVKVLGDSAALLFPTKRLEGFPMVIPEAMMASLPVVAINLGGSGEAIVNQETGFLIEKNQWNEFTEKVISLAKNEDLIKKMGEAARIRALELFSVEVMAASYLKVFERVYRS